MADCGKLATDSKKISQNARGLRQGTNLSETGGDGCKTTLLAEALRCVLSNHGVGVGRLGRVQTGQVATGGTCNAALIVGGSRTSAMDIATACAGAVGILANTGSNLGEKSEMELS